MCIIYPENNNDKEVCVQGSTGSYGVVEKDSNTGRVTNISGNAAIVYGVKDYFENNGGRCWFDDWSSYCYNSSNSLYVHQDGAYTYGDMSVLYSISSNGLISQHNQ